ncbi:CE051 protein, partial [Eubucco bourcierii]|nr:CE051 protein [Eubucco bourcierii]
TFLAKGSATLDKLKDLCNNGKGHPSMLWQHYTQAVLDITYFEENQLVDEDFPEESSLQKVKELISCICVVQVYFQVTPVCWILFQPISLLSAELLECLYWRKGALLYMYCHTAKERSEWLRENITIFKKCLNDGVHYLMKMLSFRCPMQLNEDVSLHDKDTARLLSEGVLSDTHLLAMMYSGEMCYWGLQHCGEEKQESLEPVGFVPDSDLGCGLQSTSLDFRETGKTVLKKYVAVCEGPLKGQGWNTASAKQMLCYFVGSH